MLYQLSYTGVTGKENLCEDMLSRCTVLKMQVSGENTAHFFQHGTIEADFFAVGSADDGRLTVDHGKNDRAHFIEVNIGQLAHTIVRLIDAIKRGRERPNLTPVDDYYTVAKISPMSSLVANNKPQGRRARFTQLAEVKVGGAAIVGDRALEPRCAVVDV